VPNTDEFLRHVDRLLRPGGKVVFQEHVRSPPGTVAGLVQDLVNMWWKVAKHGCQVNKNPVEVLKHMEKWQVEAWDLKVDGGVLFDRVAVGVALKSKIP
jgi:hypothetical protein